MKKKAKGKFMMSFTCPDFVLKMFCNKVFVKQEKNKKQ